MFALSTHIKEISFAEIIKKKKRIKFAQIKTAQMTLDVDSFPILCLEANHRFCLYLKRGVRIITCSLSNNRGEFGADSLVASLRNPELFLTISIFH